MLNSKTRIRSKTLNNDLASYTIKPLGETAIIVTFGSDINPLIHQKIKNFVDYIDSHPFEGFYESVLTYTSVAIFYNPARVKEESFFDPQKTAYKIVSELLQKYITLSSQIPAKEANTVEIPVCYEGEFAPDINIVAETNHLSIEEVISIHSKTTYLTYMIGFCPGFPYLGGMDERIATPRKSTPRLSIPAGSVGIAGKQTGCYPLSTPGGWQLIGRTPLDLFSPQAEDPTLLHPGDLVKFFPISLQEYQEIKGRVK